MQPTSNLSAKLYAALSPAATAALDALRSEATRRRLLLYLVGGSVRDLLLGRLGLDLDFAVQGDAPALVRPSRRRCGCR
ncbi:MAG TPA: hypothetical protein VFB90_00790 [Dehalococcoidia bacterium]|nr:hypothetical protein [Dehalococcoidia bacterium]